MGADGMPLRGPRCFGAAYAAMYARDPHASGSIDRMLLERMVRIAPETALELYGHPPRPPRPPRTDRPGLAQLSDQAIAGAREDEERIERIVRSCAGIAARGRGIALDDLRFGGSEEAIVARGSDWCADLARVACALCQFAGIAARVVVLADTARAYSGHVLIEAWRGAAWGAVDPLVAVVYRHADGRPATVAQLQADRELVAAHARGADTPCVDVGLFRAAAIASYEVGEAAVYAVSGVDHYTRSILEQGARGWPDGLRWLHGEDRA
jgi:hypothetical protein